MTSLLFQQQIQLEAAQNYCLYYIGFKWFTNARKPKR
jgi:hypothetical protein